MATVLSHPRPRKVPSGWVSLPCSQCQASIIVRDAAYTPICTACRRGEAEREACKLAHAVDDLIRGDGEFNVLTQAERQEQINRLGIAATAKSTPDNAPVLELPLSDSGGYEPDDKERDEIEARIELVYPEQVVAIDRDWDGWS